jgi:hypothetical protein
MLSEGHAANVTKDAPSSAPLFKPSVNTNNAAFRPWYTRRRAQQVWLKKSNAEPIPVMTSNQLTYCAPPGRYIAAHLHESLQVGLCSRSIVQTPLGELKPRVAQLEARHGGKEASRWEWGSLSLRPHADWCPTDFDECQSLYPSIPDQLPSAPPPRLPQLHIPYQPCGCLLGFALSQVCPNDRQTF